MMEPIEITARGCIVLVAGFGCSFGIPLSDAQLADIELQKIEKRRRERELAYHLINHASSRTDGLSFLSGATIGHSSSGAPYLITGRGRASVAFSLSHSDSAAAVAFNTEGIPTGIDIESQSPRLAKVADYFLNMHDAPCFSGSIEALTAAWTAKEAVYKAAPTDGLTLRQNIILDDFSADCETAASSEGENRTFISARVIDRSGRTALFGVEIIHPFNDTQTLAIATPRGT